MTSTDNGVALEQYTPVPITLAFIPLGKFVEIPPKIASAVIAVSASKGVGAGLINPSAAELTVALTLAVSVSKTLIVTVA